MRKAAALLGTVAFVFGLATGTALASQQFTGGTQTANATQPAIGGFVLPITVVAPSNGGDRILNISIGRDDLSPFASIAVDFGSSSVYYNGGYPNSVHHFFYRPWCDPLTSNPPVIATAGAARQGDLGEHFQACDVFARHAERMRANWGTTDQGASPGYTMYLWVWVGSPPPSPLPAPQQPGYGSGLLVNEFYKYELTY